MKYTKQKHSLLTKKPLEKYEITGYLNPASVRKGFLEMQSCRGDIQTTFVKDSVRTITLKIKIKN